MIFQALQYTFMKRNYRIVARWREFATAESGWEGVCEGGVAEVAVGRCEVDSTQGWRKILQIHRRPISVGWRRAVKRLPHQTAIRPLCISKLTAQT